MARLDWVYGYIDLETYRIQVLTGMLTTFCADAAPDFEDELFTKINALK
ncbi:MAG: hypothetical protein VX538_00545 [Pseudomonadota bacterium]|nr:hypothetical protein [Pseudomonadota bacterium]